jgi:hypothetical protein
MISVIVSEENAFGTSKDIICTLIDNAALSHKTDLNMGKYVS